MLNTQYKQRSDEYIAAAAIHIPRSSRRSYVIQKRFQQVAAVIFLGESRSESDFDSRVVSEIDLKRCVLILILILILIEGG